jgi:ABC-type multidrug transport system ATPase subunit
MSQNEARDQELTGQEVAELARKLFGPEEEWDDAAADFVLRLYGINPDTEDTDAYAIKLLNSVIQRKRERRQEVPQFILDLLAQFEQKTETSGDD